MGKGAAVPVSASEIVQSQEKGSRSLLARVVVEVVLAGAFVVGLPVAVAFLIASIGGWWWVQVAWFYFFVALLWSLIMSSQSKKHTGAAYQLYSVLMLCASAWPIVTPAYLLARWSYD